MVKCGRESSLTGKNGDIYTENAIVSPVKDESGKITHYVAIKEDVTERNRSVEILRARLRLVNFSVVHSLDELLQATLDEAEKLTESNIGFYHFLEANQRTLSLQAWSTNTLATMCTAEGKGSHYDVDLAGVWVDCIREKRPVIHNDYSSLPHKKGMPEGHAPVVRELVVPVMRGEKIAAILGVGNKEKNYNEGDVEVVSLLADLAWDIAERKQAELALQKSNRRLEKALKKLRDTQSRMVQQERLAAVGQLTAGIAHDFNNLLTSITGLTELMQMSEETPERMQGDLQNIGKAAQQAALLVRQMLDFSRKSIRDPRQLELGGFIQESIDFFKRTIPENIQINVDIRPDKYRIVADQTQIQQVVTNLMINARDAMPDGGSLNLKLSFINANSSRDCVICGHPISEEFICLSIADTGCGIPREQLPHIFEPFFTTKQVGKGSGLGLAQVYGIISQHKGHIAVESEVNVGTTIFIYLPFLHENKSDNLHEKFDQLISGRGETILLVEDEPDVLSTTKAMLEQLNYQVLAAKNGMEAYTIYQEKKESVAAVLSDMIMPDITGETLFYSLKAIDSQVKMIIMSGYPLGLDKGNSSDYGAAAWLGKPVTLQQLSQAVHDVLIAKSANEQSELS